MQVNKELPYCPAYWTATNTEQLYHKLY